MVSELDEKIGRLQQVLEREKLGGVLVNAQHNFAWLTGGATNGIDLSRENGAASLLVTADGNTYILASNIEMPRMLAEEVSVADFEPVEYSWQDEKASGKFVIDKAKSLISGGEVATDYQIEGKVAQCRYSLTQDEIGRYRSLGKDAGTAVRRVIDNIEPGESEIKIAEKLRHNLAVGGMTSVVTLVAADERISQYRHPVPTAKRWNNTLLLVTCAKRGGLIASLSRMVCIGEVPDELKIRTEAAAFINARFMHATRPGVTGAVLYTVAANAYAEQGFADEIKRHHQGGAAGYRTRDWVAHPISGEVVQEDQAFSWNPSLTGTKVEETCIVAGGGIEVITATADVPVITTVVDGIEYHSPGVISL
ncbi:MAG: aminopeptidase P family protein [Pyrinomonadaceae bacterium]